MLKAWDTQGCCPNSLLNSHDACLGQTRTLLGPISQTTPGPKGQVLRRRGLCAHPFYGSLRGPSFALGNSDHEKRHLPSLVAAESSVSSRCEKGHDGKEATPELLEGDSMDMPGAVEVSQFFLEPRTI